MKKRLTLTIFATLTVMLLHSPLQSSEEPAAMQQSRPEPAGILGAWVTECDAWGQPALCRSEWQAGTHADHLVQRYLITDLETGALIFEGRGLYRLREGSVDGFWEDSQGAIHPLHGDWEGGVLEVMWGSMPTRIGRSRYEMSDQGLTVTDWSLEDNGWRQFMQTQYANKTE